MSERPFFIYWNELSFPSTVTADSLRENNIWRERAQQAFKALQKAIRLRKDCRIMFAKGSLRAHIGDRPLQSWLEEWLGKDSYRLIIGRVSQPDADGNHVAVHELECELVCLQRSGEGLTRAHLAETWVWSVGNSEAGCEREHVDAQKTVIDPTKLLPLAVQVPNLATEDHVTHWEDRLDTWGEVTSGNYVIYQLGEYNIIMYSLDHAPPHVHVHTVVNSRLNAKYRIDVFEVLTDTRDHPPGLDALMTTWIEGNREHLLRSWRQCKRGAKPLKLLVPI